MVQKVRKPNRTDHIESKREDSPQDKMFSSFKKKERKEALQKGFEEYSRVRDEERTDP